MRRRKKQVFRVCGRRCGQARFCGSFSTGEFPPQATVPRTSGISLLGEWMSRLSSQITRATNCATPGYSVFLHDTMPRRKKQVFRVCGRRCGQARFCGSFSTGEFPPQATVPRTSGVPLLGEWIGHLSSQTTRATNCANPGYSVFLHDTMRGEKKQVFRVCGHARSHGFFTENRGGCSHVFIVPVSSAKSSPFRRRPLQPGRPGAPYSRIFVYYVLYFAVKPAKIFETI